MLTLLWWLTTPAAGTRIVDSAADQPVAQQNRCTEVFDHYLNPKELPRCLVTPLVENSVTRSYIAEIAIFHPELPLIPTLQEVSELSVEVKSQPVTPAESPSIFYSVTVPDFDDFEDALADDRTVDEWEVPLTFSDCRVYQITQSSKSKFTTPKISALGINVLDIRNSGRRWRLKVQTPDKETLGSYWQYCREEDVEFSLEKLYRSGPQPPESEGLEDQLTVRQREVARTVTRMGYFDQEGATAVEVAAELEISPSTLSTHLRRIMATTFEHLFGED